MKYLNLKHPEERKHEEESDAGGRSNYNERFLMDPLRSIPAILAMYLRSAQMGQLKLIVLFAAFSQASENIRPVVLQLFSANIFCPVTRISSFCA